MKTADIEATAWTLKSWTRDDGTHYSLWRDERNSCLVRKARTPKTCAGCGVTIPAGMRYVEVFVTKRSAKPFGLEHFGVNIIDGCL